MKTSALCLVRVLIADDEKAFSTVLADLVRSCGHEVVTVVHSGLDAIRAYRQHRPDVVLMDFAMARLNGLTGARIWCGYGVLAHNLTKITVLAAAAT